jgi:hypothetical protein
MSGPRKSMTVHVSEDIIHYRETVCSQNGLKKRHFDQEVYHFYIKHHPINPDITEKDNHE